jgi:hypothetical protein
MRRQAAWGNGVRILDIEFAGMNALADDEAEMFVNVSWLQAADANIKVTQLRQRWKDERDGWFVQEEKRVSGDYGLFGDKGPQPAKTAEPPAPPSRQAHYKTRVIREE